MGKIVSIVANDVSVGAAKVLAVSRLRGQALKWFHSS